MNYSIPLLRMNMFFFTVMILGTILTLALYHFDFKRFWHSSLSAKILMWVPIYMVFLAVLIAGTWVRGLIFIFIAYTSLKELRRTLSNKISLKYFVYWLVFLVAFFHIVLYEPLFSQRGVDLMIAIGFSSVMSDVTAFFFGKFFGKRYKLPAFLNKEKSYAGVIGQLFGAYLGLVLIIKFLLAGIPEYLYIPVGLGTLVGDLVNSYMKRSADVKDWGHGLPGHGGYIDRLSSLSGAFMFSLYFILIFNLA